MSKFTSKWWEAKGSQKILEQNHVPFWKSTPGWRHFSDGGGYLSDSELKDDGSLSHELHKNKPVRIKTHFGGTL